MSEADQQPSGMTRRNVLKRGIVVGGLSWTVPMVQAIGITPANAAEPSGGGKPAPKPPKPTKPPKPPKPPKPTKPTKPPKP